MDKDYIEQKKNEYQELLNNKNEIKKNFEKNIVFTGFDKYGLLDYNWYKKYKE